MMRPVGVLRPEPGNAATAARVKHAGRVALRLPLFAVRAVAWSPPAGSFDTLLATSANVFRHGGAALASLRHLPVHAVGAATARAARAAGFDVEEVGTGGIGAMSPSGRVLRLTGREHMPFPGAAATAVVYASDPLTPDLSRLSGGLALIHSARAGQRLAELVDDRSHIALAAISPAAAAGAGPGWRAVAIAERPSDAALLAAAWSLAD